MSNGVLSATAAEKRLSQLNFEDVENHELAEDDTPPRLTRKRRGRSSHILPPDSEDEGYKPTEQRNTEKQRSRKPGPKPSVNAKAEARRNPKKPKTNSWPENIHGKYPQVSSDHRYGTIVRLGDHVVELACCFCRGNQFRNGGWKFLKGVWGVQRHINQSHKDDVSEKEQEGKRDLEWVARNCVNKILLKSDIEQVKKGEYHAEFVKVTTGADKAAGR